MHKNWDGMEEKTAGRLQQWRWKLPQLSYKGRVLVVNNLVASISWHRAFVVDLSVSLLCSLQKIFCKFILGWISLAGPGGFVPARG